MPKKPPPTRRADTGDKHRVPNEMARAADGALMERSAERMHWAIDFHLKDIESGQRTKGRYSRTRDALMERFGCCDREADRAIARAKIYLAEKFVHELPTKRAEVCQQLQRIADNSEESDPMAAVVALRELAKIVGLHAPMQLELSQRQQQDQEIDLRATIDCLDEAGRAALDVVLAQVEAAKSAGRLALPPADSDVIDVEPVESGAN
jgi:hypothetical protein